MYRITFLIVLSLLFLGTDCFASTPHESITNNALRELYGFRGYECGIFTEEAISKIAEENVASDYLSNFFHSPFAHHHFLDEKLAKSSSALIEFRDKIIKSVESGVKIAGSCSSARKVLGRALHLLQDFYAHTNYVDILFHKGKPLEIKSELGRQVLSESHLTENFRPCNVIDIDNMHEDQRLVGDGKEDLTSAYVGFKLPFMPTTHQHVVEEFDFGEEVEVDGGRSLCSVSDTKKGKCRHGFRGGKKWFGELPVCPGIAKDSEEDQMFEDARFLAKKATMDFMVELILKPLESLEDRWIDLKKEALKCLTGYVPPSDCNHLDSKVLGVKVIEAKYKYEKAPRGEKGEIDSTHYSLLLETFGGGKCVVENFCSEVIGSNFDDWNWKHSRDERWEITYKEEQSIDYKIHEEYSHDVRFDPSMETVEQMTQGGKIYVLPGLVDSYRKVLYNYVTPKDVIEEMDKIARESSSGSKFVQEQTRKIFGLN